MRPAVEIPAQMLFTEYRDEKGAAPLDLLLPSTKFVRALCSGERMAGLHCCCQPGV